tara:strand:- start:270 stop:1442 length:1173 start_codon:yes stop_codon:yes gene_type:complete
MSLYPFSKENTISVESNSPKAPFMITIECDGEDFTCFGISLEDEKNISVVETLCIQKPEFSPLGNTVKIIWSDDGDKCAILINTHFELILDFENKHSYTRHLKNLPKNDTWKRFELNYAPIIHTVFTKELFEQKNNNLSKAISSLVKENSETNRLELFKDLMSSSVIVPIHTPESDPDHNIYTFDIENYPRVVCAYTSHTAFEKAIDIPLYHKSIPADFLFHHAIEWEISHVLLSNNQSESVLIYKEEFPLIALSHSAQKMSYSQRLNYMSKFLIKEDHNLSYEEVDTLIEFLQNYTWIQKAYLFKSTANAGATMLGILGSTDSNREHVSLFKGLIELSKNKETPAYKNCELTILEENSYLYQSVTLLISPFYNQKTSEKENEEVDVSEE